jgi:GntP family gluconate:H+ symporter
MLESTWEPIAILVVAVAAVFVLIIRLKLNAFIALTLAALLIGLLSSRVPIEKVVGEVTTRFGSLAGRVGLAIAMAAVIGQCLMESGAADKVTRRFVAWLGEKYSSLSLVVSGFVLSVPVFHDTVFYLLVPLARAMSVRMGGTRYVLYVTAIAAGGSVTHCLVPPTPGPLAMAATLNIDLGVVILVGLVVSAPASFAAWLYCIWIDRKMNISIREAPGLSLEQLSKIAARPESELPGFWVSMLPIALPVGLISAHTIAEIVVEEGSRVLRFTGLVGDPNIALILSAAVSVWLLATSKGLSFLQLVKPVEQALLAAGLIILITSSGGAFGGMLVLAGVGDLLGGVADQLGVSLIVLGFLVATLFKVAQGSGTVAMITSSAILAPLIVASPPPYHAVYVLMAIGSGSMVGMWMNDSGFWVFRTMTGLTEIETLKCKSMALVVLGVTALLTTMLGAWLVPLK